MAWRRPGDKPYLNQWCLVYWRIYASLGLNELNSLDFEDISIKWFKYSGKVSQIAPPKSQNVIKF